MDLSRTVSEIDGDFSRKSQNFPIPCILRPRWMGSPWNWVSGLGTKKTRKMGLPDRQRSFMMSSAVWIECTNVTVRQADGRTDTGPQQRPRLRIASRGNKTNLAAGPLVGRACERSVSGWFATERSNLFCLFWDVQWWKMSWPWNQGQRSLKVFGIDTYQSATYDFLLMFNSNHWRFRGRWQFQSKIAKFSHPVYFTLALTSLPLELSIGARCQKTRIKHLVEKVSR